MKVLVLSNTPWDVNNSFGNSYSNIFGGMENLEFANIYCRAGQPNNELNIQYFQIPTSDMAKSIIKRRHKTGKRVQKTAGSAKELDSVSSNLFSFSRKHRWILLLWAREVIWRLGKWKTKELLDFLDGFEPELIFQPIYGQGYSYLANMALFIKKHTGVPMVGYVSDDCYTLRQFSLSPLYWIDRLMRRPKLGKLMRSCEWMYVISDIQKQEYEKMLGIPCKVLTKGAEFAERPPYERRDEVIHMVFAGNIGEGRWKSLGVIGEVLEEVNQGGTKIDLSVYTATPMTGKMKKSLTRPGIKLLAPVPSKALPAIFESMDILVHVESTDLKARLLVHQSFSTKLVDYFGAGRTVLAYGPDDVASVKSLKDRDAALVATEKEECRKLLHDILKNPDLLAEYAEKSWQAGARYHQIDTIQDMLWEDMQRVTQKGEQS